MKHTTQKQILRRLSIIEGQVAALRRMIECNEYCIDIIRQSSAARHALSAVEEIMLENHLSEHVIDQMACGESQKAIDEILETYKAAKRK
ncbi:MAG: metal-sensitive transcriptional regulator [Candidatus Paceibacterota bacterium]